jgi:hypothetical protein
VATVLLLALLPCFCSAQNNSTNGTEQICCVPSIVDNSSLPTGIPPEGFVGIKELPTTDKGEQFQNCMVRWCGW